MMCSEINYFEECGYKYIDDGVGKTWQEAKEFCNTSFGTHLATISSEEQLNCISEISMKSSPWIGLYGDDDVGKKKIKEGSQCARFLPDINEIDNDYKCKSTLTAVLCNAQQSVNAKSWIKTPQIMYNVDNDNDNESYFVHYDMIFIAILLFVGINNIFICYWCLCRNKRNNNINPNRLKQGYESVHIISN